MKRDGMRCNYSINDDNLDRMRYQMGSHPAQTDSHPVKPD
jgi:hypothetical protein